MNASTLAVIGQILGQAESFFAGQPITINVPQEQINVGNVKVDVSGSIVIKKA